MANEVFENIWNIIKQKKFQLIDQINDDFICNICNKLMVKACNAPCGCKYCADCIENYLDGRERFCPGRSKFCQMKMIKFEKNVSINYQTNIRISEIVVKCPNKHCGFTDELISIENHIRTCDRNSTNCPYFEIGCKNYEVLNDEMRDHLYTEIYCHSKLLLDFINNLRNEMESMKNEIVEVKSENKYLKEELEMIKFDLINNQTKNEEFENKIKNNLSEIEELNDDMITLKSENRSLMNKLENIEKSRIIETKRRTSEQQTREIEEMEDKYGSSENKEIEMRRIIDEILDKNSDMLISNNYDEKINSLQIKIIEIEKMIEIMNFEKFEWKIENFSQQQYNYIYSEPFYSYKNGYKMCLSVRIRYFVGDFDVDVNVDVSFHLIKGEFDNDLLWPFKHGVTVDIINQMNGTVYTSNTIKYDDCLNDKGWNKPTTERNDGICFHSISKSKETIQNNKMLIKCKINL